MADVGDIIDVIKRAAIDAVEAAQPMKIVYGTVLQAKPLKIKVADKLILTAGLLTLTRNVTTYETYIKTASGNFTRSSIRNELQVNDKVVMLKNKNGTGYLVLDRVVTAK